MLPAVDTTTKFGLLPEGRHEASLDEVADLFVSNGPFGSERAVIWQAFLVWEGLIRRHLPTAVLWINGGFVTHKTWAAPSDIDVFVLARPSEINAVGPSALLPLLTHRDAANQRIQPMSGLVDGHIGGRGDAAVITNYHETWRAVTDENKDEVAGLFKGYVEVKP